ncbi:hypothetical protein UG55_102435 [Frankia sp. EI5c]|uniref:DUF58 domain-containing protein n=1 Tax=Frankia sp. EI5c TaxID=683316 RepID=UPI0007C2637A|nr:DUF58 domain-containing protein [Frankia sp. EI5c]OAA25214.1 hypothetical protein UG55_102435 [Frankia sp. EI5c]
MITRSGWGVLAGSAVLLAGGLALGYPALVALAVAGAVALVAAAGWMTARPRVRITRRIEPARITEGGEARGLLAVTNLGPRRCPPFLAVELVGGRRVRVAVPSLAPAETREVAYLLPTDRRGVFPVGPLTIGHSDPLGLFHAARSYPSRSQLVVQPRPERVLPPPTGRSRETDGRTSAAAPSGGVAFHSLREYVRGDDLRLVHWPSSARTGTLMIRHNVVPHEPRVVVVLDTSAEPYTDDSFEEAVRVAASLTVAAFDGGFPVEVRTTAGAHLVAERGRSQRGELLDLFAAAHRGAGDPGLPVLVGLGLANDGAALGVVTGVPAPAALRAITTVRQRFAMVSVAVLAADSGGATASHGVPGGNGVPGGRRPAAVPAGVFAVSADTSGAFAVAWNRAVSTR